MATKNLIILSNIGTPDSFQTKDVQTYLSEFLMDEDVVALPYLLRLLLVRGLIVPFRSRKSAAKYEKIWMSEGSPLMVYTEALRRDLQTALGQHFEVRIGMRYNKPNIEEACKDAKNFRRVFFWPLFPQYAGATSGSVSKEVRKHVPSAIIKKEFYKDEFFLNSYEALLKKQLQGKSFDHLLFSYHGLPIAQVGDYQNQCLETSELLAKRLNLKSDQYSTAFQSRIGPAKWIGPSTVSEVSRLALTKKRLLVTCPSFVSDCLETLEEIDLEIRETFLSSGGEEFHYLPCLNADETWVNNMAKEIKRDSEIL